jgi:hypothetical protein
MRSFATLVTTGVLALAVAAHAKTIQVRPGESIQAAVDAADPGDPIAIRAGTYHEAGRPCPTDASHTCAVVVTKDDIQLRGLGGKATPVVIENPGGQDQGIAIAKTGDPATR